MMFTHLHRRLQQWMTHPTHLHPSTRTSELPEIRAPRHRAFPLIPHSFRIENQADILLPATLVMKMSPRDTHPLRIGYLITMRITSRSCGLHHISITLYHKFRELSNFLHLYHLVVSFPPQFNPIFGHSNPHISSSLYEFKYESNTCSTERKKKEKKESYIPVQG